MQEVPKTVLMPNLIPLATLRKIVQKNNKSSLHISSGKKEKAISLILEESLSIILSTICYAFFIYPRKKKYEEIMVEHTSQYFLKVISADIAMRKLLVSAGSS